MRKFTVLMLYPPNMLNIASSRHGHLFYRDNHVPTYVAWVGGNDVAEATRLAQKEAAFAQSPRRKMSDFSVLMVIEGHVRDINSELPRIPPSERCV